MKTSELTGADLDWAVAKCEGGTTNPLAFIGENRSRVSESWAICGPIIEREGIALNFHGDHWTAFMWWDDEATAGEVKTQGPTPLIAAMRCYVASKLGDEIDIPEELE